MAQVAVVDDHPLFLEAIKQLAERARDHPRVQTYPDVESLQKALRQGARFYHVILDLGLAGRGGMHGLLELQYEHPELPVIIASGHDDPVIIQRALLLGAQSFIPKSMPLPQMLDALVDSLDGKRVYPAGIGLDERNVAPINRPAWALGKLTFARRRVALGAIIGLQNKVIAHNLGITEGTVRNQMTVVLESFGMRRRTELQSTFQELLEIASPDLLGGTTERPAAGAAFAGMSGHGTRKH